MNTNRIIFTLLFFTSTLIGCKQKTQDITVPEDLNYNEHIAPIIYKNCTPCHRSNSAGPFSLASYDQVKAKSKTIVKVTQSRFMPPWPADPTYSNFKGERILSDTEIEMIRVWTEDGCKEGDISKKQEPPHYPDGSQIGIPDLVIPFPEIFLEGNNKDHFFLVKVFISFAGITKAGFTGATPSEPSRIS